MGGFNQPMAYDKWQLNVFQIATICALYKYNYYYN